MARVLLDEVAAAAYIGMSVAFLRIGRVRGVTGNHTAPPAHFKLGRTVRYDQADLDAWLTAHRVVPGANPVPRSRGRRAA